MPQIRTKYYGTEVKGYDCTNSAAVETWRVYYADSTNIYLIAGDYIPYNYIPAAAGGISLIQGLYSRTAHIYGLELTYDGFNGVTNETIRNLNSDYLNEGYNYSSNNTDLVAYMCDANAWSGYAGSKAEYAIGGPSVELLVKSYNQKYDANYQVEAIAKMGYQVSVDNGTNWSAEQTGIFNTEDNLYVIKSTSDAYGYWIASPAAKHEYYGGIFGVSYAGDLSFLGSGWDDQGFRPVVCLKPEVLLQMQDDGTFIIK